MKRKEWIRRMKRERKLMFIQYFNYPNPHDTQFTYLYILSVNNKIIRFKQKEKYDKAIETNLNELKYFIFFRKDIPYKLHHL